jgi:hypothetical protein
LPTSGRRRRLRWPPRCHLEALAAMKARSLRGSGAGRCRPGPRAPRVRRAGHCGPSAPAGGLGAGRRSRAGGDPGFGKGAQDLPMRAGHAPSGPSSGCAFSQWIGQIVFNSAGFQKAVAWAAGLAKSRPGPVRSGQVRSGQVSYVAEIQDHETRKAACPGQRAGRVIFIADEQATLNGTRPNSPAGAKPAASP